MQAEQLIEPCPRKEHKTALASPHKTTTNQVPGMAPARCQLEHACSRGNSSATQAPQNCTVQAVRVARTSPRLQRLCSPGNRQLRPLLPALATIRAAAQALLQACQADPVPASGRRSDLDPAATCSQSRGCQRPAAVLRCFCSAPMLQVLHCRERNRRHGCRLGRCCTVWRRFYRNRCFCCRRRGVCRRRVCRRSHAEAGDG